MKSLFVVTVLLLVALGFLVPAMLSQGAMGQGGSPGVSMMPSTNNAAGQSGSSSVYANRDYNPYMDWASIPPSYYGRTDRSGPQFLGLNKNSCMNSATIGGMGSC